MKKKLLALLLALAMVLSLAACGGGNNKPANNTPAPSDTKEPAEDNKTPDPAPAEPSGAEPSGGEAAEITLWAYPVGGWGTEDNVKPLLEAFTAETGINVKLEYLAYADGDDKVNTALTAGGAPDLILEGPERLVANWGANGYMVDLSDLIDDTDKSEINAAALAACTNDDGAVYEYPMVITAHCMGINLDAFKAAGADQYLDLENHTWSTEDFINAVDALYAHFGDTVGAVYCKGQGGDQGTRALINNMYGGTFTNAEHTSYTWDDPKNVQAIEQLAGMDGIAFDASLEGGDEIALFYQGVLKMAFCWNIAQQLNPNTADTGEGKTVAGEEIVCMNFPSESAPVLQGGIWGLGIFDNGDEARIEAAKKFVKYMCDSEHTAEAAKISNFFAARSAAEGTDLSTIFDDNPTMMEYNKVILPNLGDYYQVTTGWAAARTAWWNTLQKIGNGESAADALAAGAAEANGAAG